MNKVVFVNIEVKLVRLIFRVEYSVFTTSERLVPIEGEKMLMKGEKVLRWDRSFDIKLFYNMSNFYLLHIYSLFYNSSMFY